MTSSSQLQPETKGDDSANLTVVTGNPSEEKQSLALLKKAAEYSPGPGDKLVNIHLYSEHTVAHLGAMLLFHLADDIDPLSAFEESRINESQTRLLRGLLHDNQTPATQKKHAEEKLQPLEARYKEIAPLVTRYTVVVTEVGEYENLFAATYMPNDRHDRDATDILFDSTDSGHPILSTLTELRKAGSDSLRRSATLVERPIRLMMLEAFGPIPTSSVE